MLTPLCITLYAVLAGLNLVGYLVTYHDKRVAGASTRANRGERIPERWIWGAAAVGGWIGVLLAMARHRHKTRKLSFQVVFVLAALVGTLGWVGWLWAFDCLGPLGAWTGIGPP